MKKWESIWDEWHPSPVSRPDTSKQQTQGGESEGEVESTHTVQALIQASSTTTITA